MIFGVFPTCNDVYYFILISHSCSDDLKLHEPQPPLSDLTSTRCLPPRSTRTVSEMTTDVDISDLTLPWPRCMPGMQVITLPEPKHEVHDRAIMLPQNVRVLRRPHLFLRSSTMSRSRLRQDATQSTLQIPQLRGSCHRKGSRHTSTSL